MYDIHHTVVRQARLRRAFTLLELLVVIAVLGVLLAILLPSLNAARQVAKRAACGSNLRAIAIGWSLYLDDHQGRFYQGERANQDYGGWRGIEGWYPRVLNHCVGLPGDIPDEKSAGVFHCPADRGGVLGRFFLQKAVHVLGTSYQTNIFLIGQDACDKFSDKSEPLDAHISEMLPNQNLRKVASPSRLLLIGDYGWIRQWKPIECTPEEKEQVEWHGKPECYNMAFLDGHVRFMRIQKGCYLTGDYAVLPFSELYGLAGELGLVCP